MFFAPVVLAEVDVVAGLTLCGDFCPHAATVRTQAMRSHGISLPDISPFNLRGRADALIVLNTRGGD